MLKIRTTCPLCGKVNYVEVSAIGFMRWQEEGVNIQNALPELSDNEREMLITGICPNCWDSEHEVFKTGARITHSNEDDDPDFDGEFVLEDEDDVMLVELGDMTDEDFEAFTNFLCG